MVNVTKWAWTGVLGFAAFVAFIEMIIAAILIRSYNGSGYPSDHLKSSIQFALFASLWQLFIGGAYIAFSLLLYTSIIASVVSNAAFLFLSWLFWLAVGASMEGGLGGVFSCANPNFAHCNQLRALEAFGWINFIVLFFAFVGVALIGWRQRSLTAPMSMSA